MFRSFALAALLLAAPLLRGAEQQAGSRVPPPPTGRIFAAHDGRAIDRLEENPAITRRMVDRLVTSVTGQPDVARAWRSLVAPTDRVGIKVSTVGGRYLSSHRGVVAAIVAGLESSGVPPGQIVIWDRESANLRAAGFTAQRGWQNVRAIDPPGGLDPAEKFTAAVLGKLIWGDLKFQDIRKGTLKRGDDADQLSSTSHLAKILQEFTKIINVPVLGDETGCGVAGALYNATIPCVDNWRRFTAPSGSGADGIAELYADDRIGRKVVLHVMDGLLAQFAGGPRFSPQYTTAHATIYASRDPVALDTHALRLIDGWRRGANLPPTGKRGDWLTTAAQMGLGQNDEALIEVQNVRDGG